MAASTILCCAIRQAVLHRRFDLLEAGDEPPGAELSWRKRE